MAESLSRTIIATTVAGVLIAGASYFFFSTRPVDPKEGIVISYREQTIPANFFAHLVAKITPVAPEDAKPFVDKFRAFFGYYQEPAIGSFTIENKSGRQVQNLTYNLADRISGYVVDSGGQHSLIEDAKTVTVSLLPDGKGTVVLLMNYPQFDPPGKFTLQGVALPVREIERKYVEPTTTFTEEYPFLSFLVMLMGTLAIALSALVAFAALFSLKSPYIIASLASADTLGQSLALLNFTKIENPAKFERAVIVAEKYFGRWIDHPQVRRLNPTEVSAQRPARGHVALCFHIRRKCLGLA